MISPRLRSVILNTLSLPDMELEDSMTAGMVPGWDSLNHVRIISAVEDAFNVRFKTVEIVRLKTIGDLQRLLDSKTTV